MIQLLRSLLTTLKEKKTDLTKEGESFGSAFLLSSLFSSIQGLVNSEPESQRLNDISTKLTNIERLIQFCETILRKMQSTEQLNPNENTFLEYIYMVSQILGMTAELQKLEISIKSRIEDYERSHASLNLNIPKRFNAFMMYMDLSSCFWPCVSAGGGGRYKSAGGAQKKSRRRTDDDNHKIDATREAIRVEKLRSSNEIERISSQKNDLLKRLPNLFSFCLDIIKKFTLESSPEISFFLSGFDQIQFNKFQYKFKIINKQFQLLKTEINTFNRHVMSEIYACSMNIESICPNVYLEKWNNASQNFCTFHGKQD